MTDTIQTTRPRSSDDLAARAEPFEVTPDLVAANLSLGDAQLEVPDEMMSAVRRVYNDRDFAWPTTVSVTRIGSGTPDGSAAGAEDAWIRISVLGTGFDPASRVVLAVTGADGFAGSTAELASAAPDPSGFFGIDIVFRAVPRKSSDAVWHGGALTLLASQPASGGQPERSAEVGGLPAHALWQWVR